MEEEKNSSCLVATAGCLLKVIGVIILMFLLFYVKSCSGIMMRQRMQRQSMSYVPQKHCVSSYNVMIVR